MTYNLCVQTDIETLAMTANIKTVSKLKCIYFISYSIEDFAVTLKLRSYHIWAFYKPIWSKFFRVGILRIIPPYMLSHPISDMLFMFPLLCFYLVTELMGLKLVKR